MCASGALKRSLDSYLRRLPGKDNVKLIVMDLSETYRNIARQYFPTSQDRRRPLPCHPPGQPALPERLERRPSRGSQESRPAEPHAAPRRGA
jgi:hypothetical protein